MLLGRPHFAVLAASAVLAVSAVLSVGAPAANALPLGTLGAIPVATAGTIPIATSGAVPGPIAAGPCLSATLDGQGRVGGITNQSCVGTGLSFIGPSTAISTAIGPTIITPAFTGIAITSAGNVAIGP